MGIVSLGKAKDYIYTDKEITWLGMNNSLWGGSGSIESIVLKSDTMETEI